MASGGVNRLLGGSPGTVLLKLVLVSLLVGAILVWLDLTPLGLLHGLERFFRGLFARGFDSLREIGRYVITGAMIVVPIWLILRLIDSRKG